MKLEDVRIGAVKSAVERQGTTFHTRDISEHPDVRRAHGGLAQDGNYHAMVGKALSNGRAWLGISEVAKADRGRGSLWRKDFDADTSGDGSAAPEAAGSDPIRAGHWAAVNAMRRPEFTQIIERFDARPEIGGTYLRVVEQGLQPVDLDPASSKPLIGIGNAFSPMATADQLQHEMDGRVATLLSKRLSVAASPEKQVEARFVRHALHHGLRLDPLPSALRLIASQWRLDARRIVDLLAADVNTHSLVVIELKPTADPSAVGQVRDYIDTLRTFPPSAFRFFAALGGAMAGLYGCDDMPEALEPGSVTGFAAWPKGDGTFELVACP